MEAGNKPELWHDLFVMVGSSAGALVGLLFVVVTLHIDKITERSDYNMRATMEGARYNIYHLLTVLVEALVVLTPQPLAFLGAELIGINLFGLRLPLSIIYRYFDKHLTISHRGGFPTALIATIIGAYLLGIVGGIAIFEDLNWGLYPVAVSCVIKLVRSVLTAWMLMFGVSRAKTSKQ
jgi:hypothetical protein